MTKVVTLTFNPFQENTYVVYETESKEALVIDPGCLGAAEEAKLFATLAGADRPSSSELQSADLTPIRLINTHCHLDHVYGNAAVAEKFGLELGIHPLEVPVLEAVPRINEAYGLPPMTPSPNPGYFIEEGETIELGEARFEVLLTPGHSPGSICFYNRAENYVIAGDVLFHRSIGRTDLPGGDFDTLMGSIRTKLFALPDQTVVYPGHGPATTIGEERRENPFLQ